MTSADQTERAARHDSLGDPVRLAVVDLLAVSDRSPREQQHAVGVASNLRAGLDLTAARPRHLDEVGHLPALVVTVCDRAHEELDVGEGWLHWSVPDPVPVGTRAAFDAAVADLRERIQTLVGA